MAILFVGSSPEDLGGITYANTLTKGRDPDYTPTGSTVSGAFNGSGGGFTINHAQGVSNTTC